MIKNLIIIIFICTLFHSCGKKEDPVFSKKDQNKKNLINQMSRSL